MPDLSANLALPYLAPSQAQKHVTHNEALQILDAVVQLAVTSRDQTSPPAIPEIGARYIVGTAAIGAWAGHEDQLALWAGTAWIFMDPQAGWRAWVTAEALEVVWSDDQWQVLPKLNNLPWVGINTTADTTNRLAVSAPATLLNHDGAGHQLKINKASAPETASLLFQNGFSGRAEMGLAGSDAWSIKVSADGSNWTEALSINPVTGLADGAAVQAGPQDAIEGRLMKVGAFGLGAGTPGVTSAELDDLLETGFYRLNETSGPVGIGSQIINIYGHANFTRQVAFVAGVEAVMIRQKVTGIWGNWVLHSVSSGSNANGRYVRFPDGTQICTHVLTLAYATSSIITNTWTFPSAFSHTPVPSSSLSNQTSDYTNISIRDIGQMVTFAGSPTQTHCNLYRVQGASGTWSATSEARNVRVSAIGRWY